MSKNSFLAGNGLKTTELDLVSTLFSKGNATLICPFFLVPLSRVVSVGPCNPNLNPESLDPRTGPYKEKLFCTITMYISAPFSHLKGPFLYAWVLLEKSVVIQNRLCWEKHFSYDRHCNNIWSCNLNVTSSYCQDLATAAYIVHSGICYRPFGVKDAPQENQNILNFMVTGHRFKLLGWSTNRQTELYIGNIYRCDQPLHLRNMCIL